MGESSFMADHYADAATTAASLTNKNDARPINALS
jgi:hypothetical protein